MHLQLVALYRFSLCRCRMMSNCSFRKGFRDYSAMALAADASGVVLRNGMIPCAGRALVMLEGSCPAHTAVDRKSYRCSVYENHTHVPVWLGLATQGGCVFCVSVSFEDTEFCVSVSDFDIFDPELVLELVCRFCCHWRYSLSPERCQS